MTRAGGTARWPALLPLLGFCLWFLGGCEAGVMGPIAGVTVIGVGRGVQLYQPRAIEVIPADGSCVVIDRSGRVHRFDADGEPITSWVLPQWQDGQPIDLTLTPWGTLLVADTHYHRVLEYDLEGEELRRICEDAGLELVRGIAVADDGTIFVADYGDAEDRIHRFDRAGRSLGTFGSRGDGPGQFLRPEGLTIGADGTVFVVDCGHHRVLRFRPDGELVGCFGQPGDEPGSFLYPFDIARGSHGTLYVVDYQGNRVQRFSSEGEFLGAVGGAGREPGRFATPRGVAVLEDEDGDLVFVADTYNHRVQRFRWKLGLRRPKGLRREKGMDR